MGSAATYLRNILGLRQQAEESASFLPPLMVHAQKAVTSILHGEHAQAKSGTGERFWQFRDYMPEDRPQDIDWRQSAKTDRIFIRQKELQTTQTALLWCAAGPGMEFRSRADLPTKQTHAQIMSLALGLLLTRAGERISLFGSGQTGRSEHALENFAKNLVAQTDKRDLPDAERNPPPRNSIMFMIGDFLSPLEEIESSFQAVSARGVSAGVVQVLDPVELTLDYQGRVVFESPRRDFSQHVANVTSIRASYVEKIKHHIDLLSRLCHRYGWDYQLHTTDRAVEKTLFAIWVAAQAKLQTLDKRQR
jgi:uncharacterized protein (DUF58 family)